MIAQTNAGVHERPVTIPSDHHRLQGNLVVPPAARGAILFAHGSGSGRFSPRNQFVAGTLQRAGLATLLLDLLEEEESEEREKVFDINLLAHRLRDAADWLHWDDTTRGLSLGYFGASTGAAAALVAAAEDPEGVAAVVSRGGRPDLAWDHLYIVKAPTLLIVGGDDDVVVGLNAEAERELQCLKEMIIIPGATHLFSEEGALEQVAHLAREWFLRYLPPPVEQEEPDYLTGLA
jgi:putative phosphoribosyl transferase